MPMAYFGKEFTFVQPDGKEIQLRGWGDQNYAVFEDPEGYTVIKDPASGYYQYARLSADKSDLEPTGKKVGSVDPGTLGLEKHLRITKKAAKAKSRGAYGRAAKKTRWQERRESAKAAKKKALKAAGVSPEPPTEERKGKYTGLCLLIQFPDVKGTIEKAEVENFCNKKGYTGYGNNGSVHDYFSDNSRGRLEYTNIVAPYYTAKHPKAYYLDPRVPYGVRAVELIQEALDNLKAAKFDFSKLSIDDRGYIYALNAYYAGPAENEWYEGLWPHSSSFDEPYDLGHGRKMSDYQITDMGNQLTLATFCHENGHMVCDFPDLYDYHRDGVNSCGAGNYCLMAFGGPDEKNPTQICAYLKYRAGWADKVTPLSDGTFSVKAGVNDFLIHRKNPDEYFIIENRFKEKRDSSLPASGLALWHVDETGDNEHQDMTPEQHYECSLEQADGRFDLERYANPWDVGDLFYAPWRTAFGSTTTPDSKWWDGTPSKLEVIEISEPGKEMSLTLGKKAAGGIIELEESPAVKIPNNKPAGITRSLNTTASGRVKEVEVSVDISHPNIGDLTVTLISPKGTTIKLHNRTGGTMDDIKKTYTSATHAKLKKLADESITGTWNLKVADHAKKNVGKLNHWSLKITSE